MVDDSGGGAACEVRALDHKAGSRFATLNAGGIILVKLVAASYYVIPATFASAGYPGPPAIMFDAVNA